MSVAQITLFNECLRIGHLMAGEAEEERKAPVIII